LFAGIDEIDWSSLRHAYGSAEDVPHMLRGLTSADPRVRDHALDDLLGAVHHEGDIYDSTLACIPVLFQLLASLAVDRAEVVQVLTSIGSLDDADDADSRVFAAYMAEKRRDTHDDDGPDLRALATAAITSQSAVFTGMLDDPDAEVRRAAATAVVRFAAQPQGAVTALAARLGVERDVRVLVPLVEALGSAGVRYPDQAGPVIDALTELTAGPVEAGVSLAALGQQARVAPGRLPEDFVETVLDLLHQRAAPEPRPQPDRPSTDTLVSALRDHVPVDDTEQLMDSIHLMLGGDVGTRTRLLCGQLRSPVETYRIEALRTAGNLFRKWRGDYTEPVALIGEYLTALDGRLRTPALRVLTDLYGLAAPAADQLAAIVADPTCQVIYGQSGSRLADPLIALLRIGDARAVAALGEVLERRDVPAYFGQELRHVGPAAGSLVGVLRDRLAATDAEDAAPWTTGDLMSTLGRLGDRETEPHIHRILAGVPDDSARGWTIQAGLRGLHGCGTAESVPVVRALLADDVVAVSAAETLWLLTHDPVPIIPVLRRHLTEVNPNSQAEYPAGQAAKVAGSMADAARDLLPLLHTALGSNARWLPFEAACAISRITREITPTIERIVRDTWTQERPCRDDIATFIIDLGPPATALHDLLRTELANPRRHRAVTYGYSDTDILSDEELLALCKIALQQTP